MQWPEGWQVKRTKTVEIEQFRPVHITGVHKILGPKVLCALFALPPFSPPLPSVVELSKQIRH